MKLVFNPFTVSLDWVQNPLVSVGIAFDGMGVVVEATSNGFYVVSFAGTIKEWFVVADQSGSCVVDVKRNGTSIVGGGGNKPTLSTAQRANAVPSGWTSVAIAAEDELEFVVDSCSTITRIQVFLTVEKA